MNKITAIIPMKAHSERVKDKNFRIFNGKPLFYWIFNTLSEVDSIKKIVLDTDSEQLADLVLSYFPQTDISLRPDFLRGDFISVNRLIEYVIDKQPSEDYFLQTHSTNPCLKPETVSHACKLFFANPGYDSMFSANRLQIRLYDKNFHAMNHDPGNLIRTQDLDPIYEENSNFYIFSRDSFYRTKARIGVQPFIYEMKALESLDIDTEDDFRLAEIVSVMHKK